MGNLTDVEIRNALPKEKVYKLRDGEGLLLEVPPKGNKRWRYRYWIDGKEKYISLGTYPRKSLKEARIERDLLRAKVKNIDNPQCPSLIRKQAKAERREIEQTRKLQIIQDTQTFKKIALEWHKTKSSAWSKNHAARIMRGLEKNIFPKIGEIPIRSILAPELLKVLRIIEARGANETAHRELSTCGQIFRYGIACGYCERNPSAEIRGSLKPVVHTHHPSITDHREIGELLRRIDIYHGNPIVRCALKLAPHVFVRPGELRFAEWSEFNFQSKEWRLPPQKMKSRNLHIVPLSKQAMAILEELKPECNSSNYLFPGRSSKHPISENTLNAALRYMGYAKNQMTGHGFRSIASTYLNEKGWNRDAIERQLAHAERDEVRRAYNYADYLEERRNMMQWWSDEIDRLKTLFP